MKRVRITGRPWACRRRGGWVIKPESFIEAVKAGDAVRIGEITVGTKNLVKIIRGMALPDNQYLLIKANGSLEIETIGIRFVRSDKGNYREGQYHTLTPRLRNYIKLHDNAWVPGSIQTLVVLKPKKFN